MNTRTLKPGLLLALLLGLVVGGWSAHRAFTTPAPPHLNLAGTHPEVTQAIEKAMAEVRREPRSGDAWGNLAVVLHANGFPGQAADCYRQAERFDLANPRWPYLRGLCVLEGDRGEGIRLLRQALSLAQRKEDRALILFRLARLLIEEQQLDEAGQQIQSLEVIEADSPRVHFALGLLAVARDDRAEARRHLRLLTEQPAARRQACALLASLETEDKEAAKKYAERASQLPRDLPWPDSFEAEAIRTRVDRAHRITRFRELKSQGRHQEAIAFLREYVTRNPDPEACLLLGSHLFAQGQLDDAEAMLRSTIQHEPSNAKARLFLGEILCQKAEKLRGEPGAAERVAALFHEALAIEDQALVTEPTFGLAHLTRGKALKGLGQTDEALRAFGEALRGEPHVADVHLALGELLAETGQFPEAFQHLENAVQFAHPGDPRPAELLAKWREKANRPVPK